MGAGFVMLIGIRLMRLVMIVLMTMIHMGGRRQLNVICRMYPFTNLSRK